MLARAALYYAPASDDPLWRRGCAWLGRDPELAVAVEQPALPGIAEVTADARVYGFHATLKPPMRLTQGWAAFIADVEALADRLAPFDLPALQVADLSGFLALRETAPCPALHALADACVEALDPHRAPHTPAELARRRRGGLSDREEALLTRWGYPAVFETWRFHMTLTRRLSDAERPAWREAAEAHLAPASAVQHRVEDICVFTQPAPNAPFRLARRVGLRG